MKLNKLINYLVTLERELGDVEVDICVEPEREIQGTGSDFDGTMEQFQFEDNLNDIATDGTRVILLGKSFR